MLKNIAEQKLKLFRTIDTLGLSELIDIEILINKYLEQKNKEKELKIKNQKNKEKTNKPEISTELNNFLSNIEQINESKQLLIYETLKESYKQLPEKPKLIENISEEEINEMLKKFRNLNMTSYENE